MLSYGWPILIGGTAYVVNEVMDRVFLRELLPQDTAEYTLGVYGACFKLAIFITLFVQAFRLAVEPFFFSHAKDRDARQTYAAVTLYFTIAVAAMYIGVMANLSWLQLIIGEQYRSGIDIVPIVLFANVFLGLYYNLDVVQADRPHPLGGLHLDPGGGGYRFGDLLRGAALRVYGGGLVAPSHLRDDDAGLVRIRTAFLPDPLPGRPDRDVPAAGMGGRLPGLVCVRGESLDRKCDPAGFLRTGISA